MHSRKFPLRWQVEQILFCLRDHHHPIYKYAQTKYSIYVIFLIKSTDIETKNNMKFSYYPTDMIAKMGLMKMTATTAISQL